jgi:hypothetical protein
MTHQAKKRHFRIAGKTWCGIAIERVWTTPNTWRRKEWGGGPPVLISEEFRDVDCERCRKIYDSRTKVKK